MCIRDRFHACNNGIHVCGLILRICICQWQIILVYTSVFSKKPHLLWHCPGCSSIVKDERVSSSEYMHSLQKLMHACCNMHEEDMANFFSHLSQTRFCVWELPLVSHTACYLLAQMLLFIGLPTRQKLTQQSEKFACICRQIEAGYVLLSFMHWRDFRKATY